MALISTNLMDTDQAVLLHPSLFLLRLYRAACLELSILCSSHPITGHGCLVAVYRGCSRCFGCFQSHQVDKAVKIKTGEHKTNKKTGKSEENIRVLEVEV